MSLVVKIQAQEYNWVRLFGEMTNALALSEKKPPLKYDSPTVTHGQTFVYEFCVLWTFV